MIKGIFFDVGGVLMTGSFIDFVNKSYQMLGIEKTFSTNEEVVFDSDLNKGLIEHEDCFRKFFGVPITSEQMKQVIKLWTSTWVPSPEMFEVVRALKENYRLAIFSNSDSLNSANYSNGGWYSDFDLLILSHELGTIKPERKIYEIALEKMGFPAEECLFIDDQPKALAPAKAMGMSGIRFQSVEQLKSELKELGIIY